MEEYSNTGWGGVVGRAVLEGLEGEEGSSIALEPSPVNERLRRKAPGDEAPRRPSRIWRRER